MSRKKAGFCRKESVIKEFELAIPAPSVHVLSGGVRIRLKDGGEVADVCRFLPAF